MVLNLSGCLSRSLVPPSPFHLSILPLFFQSSLFDYWYEKKVLAFFLLFSLLLHHSISFLIAEKRSLILACFIKRELGSLFFLDLQNKGTASLSSLRGNHTSEHYGATTSRYKQHWGILLFDIWSINFAYTSIRFATDAAIFAVDCEQRQWNAASVWQWGWYTHGSLVQPYQQGLSHDAFQQCHLYRKLAFNNSINANGCK